MGVATLEKILASGLTSNVFQLKRISDLDKSCCKISSCEVVDFDETVRAVYVGKRIPPSCDALKIIPSKLCFDFIELKGFHELLKWNREKKDEKELIKEKIDDFNFKNKIVNSISCIINLIYTDNSFQLNKNQLNKFGEIEKNYIIVVGTEIQNNGLLSLVSNLNYLSTFSSELEDFIMKEIGKKTKNIVSPLHGLKKPIIMKCSSIDKRYN